MPVLTPFELWQQTGRDYIQEIFRLKDRKGADYVLPMTHEETVTFHARECRAIASCRRCSTTSRSRNRDEPRPRGGLIRLREFIMKDAYSFDRDEEGLAQNFELQRGAYKRILERCGVEVHEVKAETGMMGGERVGRLPRAGGCGREHTRQLRERRLRRRHRGRARDPARACVSCRARRAREIETPGVKTCEALAEFLDGRRGGDLEGDAGDRRRTDVVLALIRGDDRLEPRSSSRRSAAHDRRRTRRSARRSARVAAPSDRSASRARSSPTRRCATASSSPAQTATAGISAEWRPAATSRPDSPICASRPRATPVRIAAAPPL